MDLVEITQKLVSIPSYVNAEVNEHQVGEFIYSYLQELGYLQVIKQPVEGSRFNVIAHDGSPTRLLFGCHMDTVPPSADWQHNPFGGEVIGDFLYGLGASDMKGGTACLLHSLASFRQTKGLLLLFDVDEEYYFKGINKFVAEYEVHPDLAVFPEPGLEIQNGHRGLIEVYFRVRGTTGHASRPQTGKNAILGAVEAVQQLLEQLKAFNDPHLGESSCNLAFLRGGVYRGEGADGNVIIEERGNKIPDIAEVVLDIRPADSKLRSQTILDMLDSSLRACGYNMERPETRIDYGSLLIPRDQLNVFESTVQEVIGNVAYAEISQFGYGEAQLLNERFGTNCVYFGPGPSDQAHKVDEHVSIADQRQVSEVYKKLIEQYCSV